MGGYTKNQKIQAIAAAQALNTACEEELLKYPWWKCLFNEKNIAMRKKLKAAIKRNKRDLRDVMIRSTKLDLTDDIN